MRVKRMIFQLLYFRIVFGSLLFILIGRYFSNDWIRKYFIDVKVTFPHFQWDFLQPLPPLGMYLVFIILLILSFFIIIGLYYQLSCISFSLIFAYQHLLDKANFLNHYYLVFLLCVLSIFIPADKFMSYKTYKKRSFNLRIEPWTLWILRFQLGMVYFFGALAKCKYDWMVEAQPLKIWLIMNRDIPFFGQYLTLNFTPYFFSYAGFLFDLLIFPFLISKKYYKIAYLFVLFFHIITSILFPIGMFPWIMIFLTPICFPEGEFKKLFFQFVKLFLKVKLFSTRITTKSLSSHKLIKYKNNSFVKSELNYYLPKNKILRIFLILYIFLQITLPFRYLLYAGNVLWTEQGYRFSWHIMAAHKSGEIEFFAVNKTTGEKEKLMANKYLSKRQWAQMKTEAEMIWQFAQFLGKEESKNGRKNFGITTEAFVSLNGHPAKQMIDPNIDLLSVKLENFSFPEWVTLDDK